MARDTQRETAPAISDPVLALLVASSTVTILLCVLTEHFAEATAALVAYAGAWGFLRRG
jgi:hypothetical protein